MCIYIYIYIQYIYIYISLLSLVVIGPVVAIRNYLHLERGVTLQLNNFESPLPKNYLCQDWLSLTNKIVECSYLPLRKSVILYLNNIQIPKPKNEVYNFEIGPCSSSKEEEYMKSLQTDKRTGT